ncbi:MAG: DUF6263 family protein [Planctomycetota bacterium]|nr:DUF6263 family protein [Planctomycetota bacterium]
MQKFALLGGLFLLAIFPLLLADEAEKYHLVLKLAKGEKLYYESVGKQSQTMVMMADKRETVSEVVTEYEVTEVSEDFFSLSLRILKIKNFSPAGEYDSEKESAHPLSEGYRRYFDALLNHPLKGKISPKGEVKEVEGFEGLEKEIENLIQEALKPYEEKPAFKDVMSKVMRRSIEDNLKAPFSLCFFLPQEKVSVGDKWTIKQMRELATFEWEATLKEVNEKEGKLIATIMLALKAITYDKKSNPLAAFETPEGVKGEGVVLFNIRDGRLDSMEANLSYDRKSNLSGQIVGSQAVETKIKLLKEKPATKRKEQQEEKKESPKPEAPSEGQD